MLRLLPRHPDVVVTNPGYFRVTEANIFLHLALAVDFVFSKHGAHLSGSWQGVRSMAPLWVWGLLHLTVAVLLLLGLYTSPKFSRAGMGCMAILCGAEAGSFLYGYTQPHATLFGFIALAYLSYTATVGYREPRAIVPVDLENFR